MLIKRIKLNYPIGLLVSKNILINSNSRKLLKYCEFTSSFLSNKTLRDSKTLTWSVDDAQVLLSLKMIWELHM